MIVGIDAFNLRAGGGITHLAAVLAEVDPTEHGFQRIVVWGCENTLRFVEDRPWLSKRRIKSLEGNALNRFLWHIFSLKSAAKSERCDIVFSPGGIVANNFKPNVTMCRNMLPFDAIERKRFSFGWTFIKLALVRYFQIYAFRRSAGVIYLNDYARREAGAQVGKTRGLVATISHGVRMPKLTKIRVSPRLRGPTSLLYVSTVSPYKHQSTVIQAVKNLTDRGFDFTLDIVGGDGGSLEHLLDLKAEVDPDSIFLRYHGEIDPIELQKFYSSADIAIFASSCENMPNILIEKMSYGLPIICSNKEPMTDILKDAGEYFGVGDVADLERKLEFVATSINRRDEMGRRARELCASYSWADCARLTFKF